MKYTVPRGTNDILPVEVGLWQQIEAAARDIFRRYQFQELRTPIFESTDLFEHSIGGGTDIVEKEMYTFNDKGGRSLTLRPEGTAPIVRSYIEHAMYKSGAPGKIYYIGPMFRYERPQAGRFRQFHQAGVEYLGSAHAAADAEVIALGIHLFDRLGLRGLSVSINSVGCRVCRPVIEERLKQFMGASLHCLCEDCQKRFHQRPLRILDCKKQRCQAYFAGLPDIRMSLCHECSDHFNSVLEYLDLIEIPFTINSRLVRGLDYYTRTTFEIVSDQLGAQNTLCGGGRYDYLVRFLDGPETPAVGLAFGLERVVMLLKKLHPEQIFQTGIDVMVAPLGLEQQPVAFRIMNKLRQMGLACDADLTKTAIKAHLKQANRLNARHVAIIGEEEHANQVIQIKNMATGEQATIPISQLETYFKSHYA